MDRSERWLKRARRIVARIKDLEPEMRALSDADLRQVTPAFKRAIDNGADLDHLLPRAFAAAREASRRVLDTRHTDTHLLGGIALHGGMVAEIHAGEGKTLTATLPAYLNALTGQGVHLVAVNDYLAQRDWSRMAGIYTALGLTAGVIQSNLPVQGPERQAAYAADVTYGSTDELAFDYLRDNVAPEARYCVQRGLGYAIVDEADALLIDFAPTPLTLTEGSAERDALYGKFARAVPLLRAGADYIVDRATNTVSITETGVDKIERMLGIQNVYLDVELARHLENALKAHAHFQREKQYVVRDGNVVIVDEPTGRILPGRRYSGGLHQAIEAKEGVAIHPEGDTKATITGRSFFRLYGKLAGMTGTATLAAEELHDLYFLDVVSIPTHRPIARTDYQDSIYKSEEGKFGAVVEDVAECHERGQPVLVGTSSVARAEALADRLTRAGIANTVIPQGDPPRAAARMSQAGRIGAVTVVVSASLPSISTDIPLGGNPHGFVEEILRERDIDLEFATGEDRADALDVARQRAAAEGDRVIAAGGLHVIGSERALSRRLDLRLRDHAGLQGQPGSARFYVALTDEVMRRFGADRNVGLMNLIGMEDDMPIESSRSAAFIRLGQDKVEAYDRAQRERAATYDAVFAAQRETIYHDRRAVLEGIDAHDRVLKMIRREVRRVALYHLTGDRPGDWDQNGLVKWLDRRHIEVPADVLLSPDRRTGRVWRGSVVKHATDATLEAYARKERQVAEALAATPTRHSGDLASEAAATMRQFERAIILRAVDGLWADYLTTSDVLMSEVELVGLAPLDPLLVPPAPLVRFKARANDAFGRLMLDIQAQVVELLFLAPVAMRIDQTAP